MDTLLTLVIALGGIATGIGAIWAAVVARRQAQTTEQSLAQTERSLAEQSESLREQNERTRLNLEVDLLFRMAIFLRRRLALDGLGRRLGTLNVHTSLAGYK